MLSCKWPKAVQKKKRRKKKRRKLTSIWLLEAVRRILVFPCSFTCRNMSGRSRGQARKITEPDTQVNCLPKAQVRPGQPTAPYL